MPKKPLQQPSLAGAGAGAEWSLLAQFQAEFPSPKGALGIGDDAAAWPLSDWALGGGHALACTDILVEGTHFKRSTTSPFALGWKALAVNLSDLAAMGGMPRLALVGLALDPKAPEWGPGAMGGIGALAKATGTWVAGGDTVGVGLGNAMVVGASVMGQAPRPVRRQDARAGDCLLGTGPFGAAAAGLWVLNHPKAAAHLPPWALAAVQIWHQSPWPRLALGQALGAWVAAKTSRRLALLDDSDGLRRSAWLLATAAHVGVVLDAKAITQGPSAWCVDEAEGWAQSGLVAWQRLLELGASKAKGEGLGQSQLDAALQAWLLAQGPLVLARQASAAVAVVAQAAGVNHLEWALDGGEDYGLVVSCPPEAGDAVRAMAIEEGLPLRPIGWVEAGSEQVLLERGGMREALAAAGGFAHL